VKVLVHDPNRCTGCHACEDACAEKWFQETDRAKSRIQILDPEAAEGAYSAITCTQCGDCIDICPTGAISRTRSGVVVIQKKACVGCLACVAFCSIGAMRYHDDQMVTFKCVACGACVDACPEDALRIQEVDDAAPSETVKWAERMAAR
jgi:carbon-monoxide dehydrogenase iron sulfur subunit